MKSPDDVGAEGGSLLSVFLRLVRSQVSVDGRNYKYAILSLRRQKLLTEDTVASSAQGEHQHTLRAMATVVPCASCYASSIHSMGLFGRGPGGGYMSLLTYHGPRWTPQPRLAYHDPKLTLRQICHMLRVMREIRDREAVAAARKQGASSATPSSPTIKSEKRCLPACFRRRRSNNIKRVS